MEDGEQVLKGFRVLEVGSFIAGPAAATLLGDFGAEVVKVEPPGEGDPWRYAHERADFPKSATSYPFVVVARNKKSVALDLKHPAGRAVLDRMIDQSDVLLTNLPFPVRDRLGIGQERALRRNSRLVYASMTAYGEFGEERDKPGFDTSAYWARSGLMDLVRSSSEGPYARPVPGIGDFPTALALFSAIMLALFRRERSGCGGAVGTSLLACGAYANSFYIQAALCGATAVKRPAREDSPNPIANAFRCRDGRSVIISLNSTQLERSWRPLLKVLGRGDLLDQPDFRTYADAAQNPRALLAMLDESFLLRDAGDWKALLEAEGVISGLVGRAGDAIDDQQMKDNGVVVPLEGVEGTRWTVGSPMWLSGSPKAPARRPPEVGEDADATLRDFGIDDDEIGRLRRDGILG